MFEPDEITIDGGNSVLCSLSIIRLHMDVFVKLLQFTNSLKYLACSIPVPGPLEPVQSTNPRTRAEPVRIPYVLSPQSFMPALCCLSQTLTSLCIHSTGQLWDKYDGTRLDFSNFPILKELKASPLCFFSPRSCGFSRDGLYKLLPPSLEHLNVSLYINHYFKTGNLTGLQLFFGYDIGIFYSLNGRVNGMEVEKVGRAHFVAGELEEWEYRWISELAIYKEERLPSLVSVHLREAMRLVMSC